MAAPKGTGRLRDALRRYTEKHTRAYSTDRRASNRRKRSKPGLHYVSPHTAKPNSTQGTYDRATLPYVLYRRTAGVLSLLAQNLYEAPLEVMAVESRLMRWNDGSTFHVCTRERWTRLNANSKARIPDGDG